MRQTLVAQVGGIINICAAYNNANHDARLLFAIVLASCRALSRLQGARHEHDSRGR